MLTSNSDLSSSILSRPPMILNSIESSSPTAPNGAHVALSSRNRDRDDSKAMPDSQIQQSGSTSEDVENYDDIWENCMSDPLEKNHHDRWMPNVSPAYDTSDTDDDSSMELLRFKQDSLQIVEPSGVGVGLWNLGNTCFINSVLQCFTHTVPLIKSLCSFDYEDPCNCSNERFCVLRALRNHIEAALTTSRYAIHPFLFVNNLNYFSPDFRLYQQEDAHEFLQAFLDKLERCCLDQRSDSGNISSQDFNIVEHVFGGRLVSVLRCCSCNSVSKTFENSVGLSLEIEDVDDLCSALDSFTRVEKLEKQLTCDNCKEQVLKEKQLLVDKLPLVATFHLKRFKNNGFFMEKIFKHVRFPLELDLQPYMSSSQTDEVATKYYLYAIVEHLGLLAYGHYSSYVRSAPKIWHKFDDHQVTRIDEDNVLSQSSYILFYAREGTSWFSGDIEEMQPLVDSSPKCVLDQTNGECLSDITYEGADQSNKLCDLAGVSNLHAKRERNFISLSEESNEDVFLSAAESSGQDSPMAVILNQLCPDDDSYNPCTDKEPNSCVAIERATIDGDFVPFLTVPQNQDSSPEQEGTFQIQPELLETTKIQEKEPSKQRESEFTDTKKTEMGDKDHKNMKPSPLAKPGIYKTGSPPKKLKTE